VDDIRKADALLDRIVAKLDDEGWALLVRAVELMSDVDGHRPDSLAFNAQTLAGLR